MGTYWDLRAGAWVEYPARDPARDRAPDIAPGRPIDVLAEGQQAQRTDEHLDPKQAAAPAALPGATELEVPT